MHLLPAPDIHSRGYGNQRKTDEQDQPHFSNGHLVYGWPEHRILEIKKYRPDDHPHYHHRLKPDETKFEKVANTHFAPAVIIGIGHNKTRKDKEKIYGEITVIDDLIQMTCRMRFKKMKRHDHDGGNPTKSVEDQVVRFGDQ